MTVPDRSEPALAHLRLRFAPLHRALAAAVDRRTELTERLARPDLTPYCVAADQAEQLLGQIGQVLPPDVPPTIAEPGEAAAETALRRTAAAAGMTLPLDDLAARFRLGRADQDALLLLVAPELNPAYERLYAYVVDNVNRGLPGPELLIALFGPGIRRRLGPAAPLLRYGLVRPLPGAPSWVAQELTPAPGLVDLLLGEAADAGLIGHDPAEVVPRDAAPPGTSALRRLASALEAGRLDVAGLWGGAPGDAALALATYAGRPLRRLPAGADPDTVATGLRTAAALGAIVWVRTDDLPADAPVAGLLARSRVPVVLTGVTPWRPVSLLSARAYGELDLAPAGYRTRREAWAAALPGLPEPVRDDLAVRYRMNGEELRAVAAVAATGARLAGDSPLADHVGPAVAAVTRGRARGYLRAIAPRRSFDDLVLPPEQLAHVREISAAFRAWPRVAEAWGFGGRSGETGVKVLFTGESGTGKTLTAEVLAGAAGMELLAIDLSQVVSKWVGETEKNLEAAFRQAEESQAVLFFDEADALFGKRGEVKHGTDRYANLEVGYLLQRLEGSPALAILASNLRENIDAAFTRRFHFAVNFTRPGPAERRRLWRLAFPPAAPLAPDVDLDALSRLDLTGAAIASAARSAALLAAEAAEVSATPDPAISMRHVVGGVARQFQREARLLRATDLGRYADLLPAA
ncbi:MULTISPECIES: AAA family ATPase [Catenuloplanes]|uniref:AAA+ ATPase domain-containing protein n=1 Tax=Catenuloplanes niger TaxID=587534 RepID=A0AAE4CZW5_9ACTN|nr:ATP-binding protein [Catenuloplanes niger]MDR7327329.1 hypothetical protein [Catenuloplanes niger]